MQRAPQENGDAPREIDQRMGRVEDTLLEVVDNVRSMRTDTNRIGGYVSNIQGSDYQRKVEDSLPAIAGAQLNVRRCHVLKGAKLSGTEELDGMIPGDDYVDDIYEIDLVFSGREKGSAGETLFFAAEISPTVDHHDLTRSQERAQGLTQATGKQFIPVVIGANWPEPQRAQARELGVRMIVHPV